VFGQGVKMILRYDRGEIKGKHFTSEGFLKVDAVFTRTGVFDYRNADGSARRELRHPEDVLKDDSLKSMEMLPITLLHPKERVVDADNSKKVSIGFTGEKISHDGSLISGTVMITDKKAIEQIENLDIHELSLGYQVKLVEDKGEFQGERHDVRQTEIVYNHLAVVPQGRAGVAELKLDADDAIQTDKQDRDDPKPKPKENNMDLIKHNLDGIAYDTAPQIANELKKQTDAAEKAGTDLKLSNDSLSKLQGEFDSQKEKLDKAEKIDHSEEIQKKVDGRIFLVGSALKHLDAKEVEGIEKKTDSEIQLQVIQKYSPEFNKDGKDAELLKNDAYMQARFDAALENKATKKNDKSGIAKQRMAMANQNRDSNNDDVDLDKSRNDYMNDLTNAYKLPEPAKA